MHGEAASSLPTRILRYLLGVALEAMRTVLGRLRSSAVKVVKATIIEFVLQPLTVLLGAALQATLTGLGSLLSLASHAFLRLCPTAASLLMTRVTQSVASVRNFLRAVPEETKKAMRQFCTCVFQVLVGKIIDNTTTLTMVVLRRLLGVALRVLQIGLGRLLKSSLRLVLWSFPMATLLLLIVSIIEFVLLPFMNPLRRLLGAALQATLTGLRPLLSSASCAFLRYCPTAVLSFLTRVTQSVVLPLVESVRKFLRAAPEKSEKAMSRLRNSATQVLATRASGVTSWAFSGPLKPLTGVAHTVMQSRFVVLPCSAVKKVWRSCLTKEFRWMFSRQSESPCCEKEETKSCQSTKGTNDTESACCSDKNQ